MTRANVVESLLVECDEIVWRCVIAASAGPNMKDFMTVDTDAMRVRLGFLLDVNAK
jgi:hypothetical protein